jgi:molybdopterin/thiamine biosynthesis adenylyltransferase
MIDPLRHMSIFSPDLFEDRPVNIIGAGATGSNVAMQIAKLGVQNIHVWDFDTVERHNIANQIYGNKDVGLPKVVALSNRILEDTGTEIHAYNEKFVDQELRGVVFLLTDTMSSRKEIWENSIRYKLNTELMVETRMGAELGRIYTINPSQYEDVNFWEQTLTLDENTEESLCGATTTVGSTATLVASLAVWQFIYWFRMNHMNDMEIDIRRENIICLRPLMVQQSTDVSV